MPSYAHLAARITLGACGLSFLLAMVHLTRMYSRLRPDVPRARLPRGTWGYDGSFFDDIYTDEGRRSRSRVIRYLPLASYLFLSGVPLLDASDLDTPIAPLAFSALGLLALVALVVGDLRYALTHRGTGQVIYEIDASGRVHAPPAPPAPPAEYGPQYRERCPCCGCPTIQPGDSSQSCLLCDWEEPDAGGAESSEPATDRDQLLREARSRFHANLTVHDGDHPEPWRLRPRSAREVQLKRMLIDAYEGLERDGALDDPNRWRPVFALERDLSREQESEPT